MSWFELKFVDPFEIESRISDEEMMGYIDLLTSDELPDDKKILMDRVRTTLAHLPKLEIDFFNLTFVSKKSQTDIAQIFRVSQPTVHYRLKKAKERIKFVLSLPPLSQEEIRERIGKVLKEAEDVEIMLLMWTTTCQSEVAKRMKTSQGKVRHRFLRSLKKLKEHPELEEIFTVYESISQNLTILREVSRKSKVDAEYILY